MTLPVPGTSWVLPLDVRRRGPSEGTPTALAALMVRGALAQRPAEALRILVEFDSGYDPVQLARGNLAADIEVRPRTNRVFFRAPGPSGGRGAPRKYGPVFKRADPSTHGEPDGSASRVDARYGLVQSLP